MPQLTANNFRSLKSPVEGGHRYIRSVREHDIVPGNTTEEGDIQEVLRAVRSTRETKGEQCRQVVLSCEEEKCGKASLYFFSKVMRSYDPSVTLGHI